MELATFSQVTLADFASTGRGVALLCDVKQGDVLLEVPLETGMGGFRDFSDCSSYL